MPDQDFVAIKLGDVNSSWTIGGVTQAKGPGPESGIQALGLLPGVGLALSHHLVQPEEQFAAGVFARGLTKVTSVQFTLQWDPTVLVYAGVGEYALPGMSEVNFGTQLAESGFLSFSWDDPSCTGMSSISSASGISFSRMMMLYDFFTEVS